jgi:pyruvate formate lyase activating enzyme
LKDLLLNWNIDYEYRTTVIKWMHTIEDIKSMAKYIKWAKNYYLQNFVWGNTLDPNFKWNSFSDDELEEMKKVAEEFVKVCKIRK